MTTHFSRTKFRRTLCITTALVGSMLVPVAASRGQTVPTGPSFPGGQTNPSIGAPTPNAAGGLDLGIQTNGNRSIINWQTFSIGARDSVNFTNGVTRPADR